MTFLILDDAGNGLASTLQRLKLAKEAATLIKQRTTLDGDTAGVMALLKIGKRLREIAMALGANAPKPAVVDARTKPTAGFYPEEGKRTLTQRQKDNNAAIALIARIKAGDVAVTDTERAILAKYSGNGGGLVGADGLTGSPHEYYTPKPIAQAMWSLLGELGFDGGSVLDPSAGTGVFTATRPKSAVMTQVELDETSGAINGAINDGPTVTTTVSPFEAIASATPDEIYDAVVTNVPFGDNAMRGDNASKDKRFGKANLQEYFILRSLQKLKPNGLAAFIVPKSIVSGKGAKESKLRLNASLMAEFLGAYRLPNSIFTTAAADVTTDLIVFRKFSRATAQKIDELQAQNPEVLTTSRVLWDEFLSGQYFIGAGHKYILGEEGEKQGKYGLVAAVLNDDSIANIAKLIKRFPTSHIDWDSLNLNETAPIVYADGDVIHASGQTLAMKDGEWHALDSQVAEDQAMLAVGTKIQKPLDAVNNGITWAQAVQYAQNQNAKGAYTDVPAWFMATQRALNTLSTPDLESWWQAVSAGMAAMELMQDADPAAPLNYVETYPTLSAQLARVQAYGNKTIGKGSRLVKDALLSIRNARTKAGFTSFWLGEINVSVEHVALTPTQLYEKIKYEGEDQTGYVPASKLREAFSGFDPLNSDEWCVSSDGHSVRHANDYYSGTYADFLANVQIDLDAATDPAVRIKIARQMEAAKERINVIDVSTMTFSLFTPHISMLQKLDFFKAYVSPDIFLTTDADGRDAFDIKQPTSARMSTEETAHRKAMQRFVKGYLRNQNISTMSKSDDVDADPAREAALLKRIKEITDAAKAQFDAWARANPEIQASIHNKLNDPAALRFIEEPDGTPLDIPNLNTVDFKPHPYQYGAVRRFSRYFSGVLGFDVGLGKTITALASVQYAQSIGVKKKTAFVVPNQTLTNWRKESGKAYLDTSDCLFVGLVTGKNGKEKVDAAQVKADLNLIRENRHAKVFMTLEAFKLIPVRDETMEAYITYLTQNDDAYLLAEEDASKKKANIAADAQSETVKATGVKSGAIPFFEDMGFDSLVLDEAHAFKNSKTNSGEFKNAKYLADPTKSQRGQDMQAKAWFIRGLSPRNDGVLSLTATPVTNSPLEAYSMLTLALGEREVNNMYGVTGADSFMAAACDIDEREEENIVGVMRPVRVFTGLQNAGLLRRLLQTSTIIKTADDVKADGLNVLLPEFDEIATGVDIGAESFERIIAYKEAYLDAVDALKGGGGSPAEKLAASPFNLIRKMTRVINDPELDTGIFTFKFQAAQAEAAAKAVATFNAKNVTEDRDYDDPHADKKDIRVKIVKDVETGESVSKFIITVRARIADNAVELLSTDYSAQETLLKLLDAAGITPTINVSPKLAALIANVKKEACAPRYGAHSKQIIFCDELSLHHKIRLAVAQAISLAPSKIKIVNAVAVDVAGMQDVQDGYNADGEDNKYSIIVANKKAEVGINLQKGTQAIHHLTIGWTPDSIHQRNGRGVRQGNPVANVNIYHYDADGTFDAYKRKLVGIKADWISALMSGTDSKIKIEGDMTAADYELLAAAVGDAGAMDRVNDEITERNKRQKRAANKQSQLQSVRIIDANNHWLAKFGMGTVDDIRDKQGFTNWVNNKASIIAATVSKIAELGVRLRGSKSDLMQARLTAQLAELRAKLATQSAVVAGLPVDIHGVPVERNQWTPISDADVDSAAMANWTKDLNVAMRMNEEAMVGFRNRTDDGYSDAMLDAFLGGTAQIISGTLVESGSFVEHNGKLLVAMKSRRSSAPGLVAYNPADMVDEALLRLTGAVFTAKGDPGWSALVTRAIALDEATIATNKDGFGASSPLLYSAVVEEVRDGITVPIPSMDISTDSFSFRAPMFPFVIEESKYRDNSPLIDLIAAEQDGVVMEGSYRSVKVSDLRLIGPYRGSSPKERNGAMREWIVAHHMRATENDIASIKSNMAMKDVVSTTDLDDAFFNALPAGVALSKTHEDLDVWALDWFANNQDWLQIDSLESALGSYRMKDYRAAQNQIEDGQERWIPVSASAIQYAWSPLAAAAVKAAIERGLLFDEIMAFPDTSYSSYMPAGFLSGDVGERLAGVLFTERDGHVELTVGVEEARTAMNLSKTARLYKDNWADAISMAMANLSGKWQLMRQWAKAYKAAKALDESGVDGPGILKALLKVPGVYAADIGSTDALSPRDKYTGMFVYQAGTYVNLGVTRGSDTFEKIAKAGAEGLQGRTFNKAIKMFRVTFSKNAVFSDGKPVATVEDLFAHLGLNMKDFTV